MPESKKQTNANRPVTSLHQLAGHIIDGGKMIGVERVSKSEAVDNNRRSQKCRVVVESNERPGPGGNIDGKEECVDTNDLIAQIRNIVKKSRQMRDQNLFRQLLMIGSFGFFALLPKVAL